MHLLQPKELYQGIFDLPALKGNEEEFFNQKGICQNNL
jgi:hypothetical protein